ncbi:MAG: L-fucose:H+ symporter permease [Bacteroidales bacterium]|nr:L-fucose:H+ symporter permease [Bacteroidales bacterium]
MKSNLFTDEKGRSYVLPFFLIASLFLLSGYTNSLLDVLNKYFQEGLDISRAQSGLVQFALYSGYFLMAIPAGMFMKKWGYNKGIVAGLFVLVAGCLLFIPGAYFESFYFFLVALFIIACGFTFFETAANPLATFLGSKAGAARRLNLAQSFNGLGWILGPLLGGLIIFSDGETGITNFNNLPIPFIILGSLVIVIAVLLIKKPLPNIQVEKQEIATTDQKVKPIIRHRHFVWAVVAQFFYVASQTGVNSFFINYATETDPAISNQQAAVLLSFGGMGLFVLGRFSGSYILKWFQPNKLLATYAAVCILLMAVVIIGFDNISIIALILTYFFMSIMYPTIFALGIKNMGAQVPKASSILVMAIVGGALCPMLMGYIADVSSMAIGFIIPLFGFLVILMFGLTGYRIRS